MDIEELIRKFKAITIREKKKKKSDAESVNGNKKKESLDWMLGRQSPPYKRGQ